METVKDMRCMPKVMEVVLYMLFCMLLCILEAAEGKLCLLEVLEVMRCVLLCILEAVEAELCLPEVICWGLLCVLISIAASFSLQSAIVHLLALQAQ